MGAFGAMVALRRRALEGGSYVVRVSLCQSAMLLQREGLVSGFKTALGKLDPQIFESLAVCGDGTIYGDMKTLGPIIRMSETNPRWNGTMPSMARSAYALGNNTYTGRYLKTILFECNDRSFPHPFRPDGYP